MSAQVVLLPSPFLGPASWEPVSVLLRARGLSVLTCDLPEAVVDPAQVLQHWTAQIPPDYPVVLVPHSNAGLYVPALYRACQVVGAVFVDAALPPHDGAVPLAPPRRLDAVLELADSDGLLPPWTRWWDPTDVDFLLPDGAVRRRVEAGQPRVPVGYFRATLEGFPGWTDRPGAYLAFGDTYAAERARAQRWGWPVATLDGRHLHLLVDPEGVAAVVSQLISELAS